MIGENEKKVAEDQKVEINNTVNLIHENTKIPNEDDEMKNENAIASSSEFISNPDLKEKFPGNLMEENKDEKSAKLSDIKQEKYMSNKEGSNEIITSGEAKKDISNSNEILYEISKTNEDIENSELLKNEELISVSKIDPTKYEVSEEKDNSNLLYEENEDSKNQKSQIDKKEDLKDNEDNQIDNVISSPSNEINRDKIIDNLNDYDTTMNINIKEKTQLDDKADNENKAIKKEKISKDLNKKVLFKIFLNYSEYSVETGHPRMNRTNFLRLMKDAQILDKQFGIIQADLVFSEYSKKLGKFYDYESFLNCLVCIIEYKFPKENKKKGMNKMLKNFLLPFYKKIEENAEKSQKENAIIYDVDVKLLLNSKFHMLRVMFIRYIDNPIKRFKTKSECMKALNKLWINLLREFDIIPFYLGIQKSLSVLENAFAPESEVNSIVNMETIFELPNNLIQLPYKITDFGYFLKFSRFYYLLVLTSNAIVNKEKEKYTPSEKIFYLLYRFENSQKFSNRPKEFFSHQTIPSTFLPNQEIFEAIKIINLPNEELPKRTREIAQEKSPSIQNDKLIIEKYKNDLYSIFINYSTKKIVKGSNSKMTYSDFIKFLKDLNIPCTSPNKNKTTTKNIGPHKINPEIIFQKIIQGKYKVNFEEQEVSSSTTSMPTTTPIFSESKTASLDFEKWLDSLSLISYYLNPNKETKSTLLDFVELKILALKEKIELENEKGSPFIHKSNVIDESLKSRISDIHPILSTFFYSFADDKEHEKMSNVAFFGFLKEFKIFPDICNFKQAQSIFSLVSSKPQLDIKQSVEESQSHIQKGDEFIDINSFIESICILSFSSSIFTRCKNKLEKIDSLMEWLLQSQSLEILCKRIGKSKVPFPVIENYLRSKESNLIGSIITKRIEREKFEDLFNDLDDNSEDDN